MNGRLCHHHPSSFAITAVVAALMAFAMHDMASAQDNGATIYADKCASCHGSSGEGMTENYPQPLVGDKSVLELTRYIQENMPAENPGELSEEASHLVAAFIHDAFYSITAQARNKPPELEFSRLTARQYEQSVADIVASFSDDADWGDERGLEADYFNNDRPNRDDVVIERTDAVVDVDFGEGSPHEDIGVEEFSIRWRGSLLAEETGEYEFIVETANAFRLWVNAEGGRDEDGNMLIDAAVRSGDDTVYRASLKLLGGRVYPIQLEFYKIKEPTAFIRLKWATPHHAEELIPARNLSPERFPALLVVNSPFPPDDRSLGYERGSAISAEWDDATTQAALEVAGVVADRLERLADLREEEDNRDEKLREFCRQFVERAFRRPLNDEERSLFVDRQFEEAPDDVTAVKRVVILALKSPRFLYREIGRGPFDAYSVASWLSYSLWDSIPDDALLEAAARGELETREQIAAQVERMLRDPRARGNIREFFHEWLEFARFEDLSKDGELFPEFDAQLVSDMRTSLELFLDDVVWSESSDYRRLLLDEHVYLNDRLAALLGAELPEGHTGFAPIDLSGQGRAGVLSHPYLMTGFAYFATSSPIHRGVFIARNVLGRRIKPPPIAVAPEPPESQPGLTTRERIALQTSPAMCASCHSMINPLGFSLEHFDAIGRFRDIELDKPIDASGSYNSRDDEAIEFHGARGLGEFLAGSPEAHEAFVERLFQHLAKQPIRALGEEMFPYLTQHFADDDFHIQRLIVTLLTESALAVREIENAKAAESAESGP
jgi:cytochrome c553